MSSIKPSPFLPWELGMKKGSCSWGHWYRHCHAELSLKPRRRHSLQNTEIQMWAHPLDLPRQSPPNNKSNSISQAVTFTAHKPQTHAPQLLLTDTSLFFPSPPTTMFYVDFILAQNSKKRFCFQLQFTLLHLQRLQRLSEVKWEFQVEWVAGLRQADAC